MRIERSAGWAADSAVASITMADHTHTPTAAFDDLLTEHAQWCVQEIPEFDKDRAEAAKRYLRMAFRVACKANPDFDVTAWTPRDTDVMAEMGLAIQREDLELRNFGVELGLGLHTFLLFAVAATHWTGTAGDLDYAHRVVDPPVDEYLPEGVDAAREVLLAYGPARHLTPLVQWVGRGRDLAGGNSQLPAEFDELAAHLGLDDDMTLDLWRFADRQTIVTTGGGVRANRGPGASGWRSGRPPIDSIRAVYDEWLEFRVAASMINSRGEHEEINRILELGCVDPVGIDQLERDEDEDPDEYSEAWFDDPFHVDKRTIRELVDKFIADGWLEVIDDKLVVPKPISSRVLASVHERERAEQERRNEWRDRKRQQKRGRRSRW